MAGPLVVRGLPLDALDEEVSAAMVDDGEASVHGGFSDDMTDSEEEAVAPVPAKPAPAAGGGIRGKISAAKEQIAELQQKKIALLEEEDFIGAQKVKDQIAAVESELQELRRVFDGVPTPARVGVSGEAAAPPATALTFDGAASAAAAAASAEIAAQEAVRAEAAAAEGVAAEAASAAAERTDATAEGAAAAAGEPEESSEQAEPSEVVASTAPTAAASSTAPVWCEVPSSNGELVQLAEERDEEQPFALPRDIQERLYAYQRQGVAWLARLYRRRQGGILADEMGLGKTVQICAFLNGVRHAGAKRALVLLPVTLLQQWKKEAETWCPDWPVYIYYGTAATRRHALSAVSCPQGGILLTSYSMISNTDALFEVVARDKELPKRKPGRQPKAKQPEEQALPPPKISQRVIGKRRMSVFVAKVATPASSFAKQPAGNRRRLCGKGAGHVAVDSADGADSMESGEGLPWDVVVCDEAHRMKNISTLLGKSLRRLRSRCRLLLTGTPVQNALQDLWALLDFAEPGLLGNHATFVKTFSDPIDRGSVRGASPFAVALKRNLAEQLRGLLAAHLLRRTKAAAGLLVPGGDDAAGTGVLEATLFEDDAPEAQQLPPKRETILWLLPSDEQVEAYKKVLERSDIVREAASKQKLGIEVFKAIGLLKRLCNHPLLALPTKKDGSWKELLDEALDDDQAKATLAGEEAAAASAEAGEAVAGDEKQLLDALGATGVTASDDARGGRSVEYMLRRLPRSAQAMLAQSAKLRCLALLVPGLAKRGHRVLIFSQSLKMLDLVQICVLRPNGLRCLRMDGLTDTTTRAEKVEKFEKQRDRFQCMLLTTSVGGVGLNLTSADRVIIVDPAWNPATDAQAVDRAYRIGQDKEVRTYRLVTSGLIEDKMFRLQVYKMGLTQLALEGGKQHSYFTAKEIRALFEWTDPAQGETRQLLLNKHGLAAEDSVRAAADEDGAAEDSWLGEWIASGASDFGLVASGFSKNEEPCTDEVETHVASVKRRLDDAQQRKEEAAQARRDIEARLEAATRASVEASEGITASYAARASADELIQKRKAELRPARKAAAAAKQQLDRALGASRKAKEQLLKIVHTQSQADLAAQAAVRAANEASESTRSAEERLSKVVGDIESIAQRMDTAQACEPDGAARQNPPGPVEAAPGLVRRVGAALKRVQKALDAVAIRQAELEVAENDLVTLDEDEAVAVAAANRAAMNASLLAAASPSPSKAASRDAASPRSEREDSVSGSADGREDDDEAINEPSAEPELSPAKRRRTSTVEPAAEMPQPELTPRRRERERHLIEQALSKAKQKADAAREAASKAIGALADLGPDFSESITKAESQERVKVEVVKAAQREAKAAFRQLMPAWKGAQSAQDAWSKAAAGRKRQTLRATAAAKERAQAEAADRETDRQVELSAADEREKHEHHERQAALLAEAEAARRSAELDEMNLRKRRLELKAEALEARKDRRPAKKAEREALTEQKTMHAECSKVERSHQRMEEAKSNAIHRLRSEAYDASQVEQAYEQRRRALAGGES